MKDPPLIVLMTAGIRFGVLGVLLVNNARLWNLNEAAGIARQLVLGHGFSSPYHGATGPTAWLAPVYPSILACIFRVFGIETTASAWAIVTLNILFASLTTLAIIAVGRQCFEERTAIIAAWAWAISPITVIAAWFIWDTSLSALLMTTGVWKIIRLRERSTSADWGLCGLILGLAALLNPSLLAALVPIAVLAGWRQHSWRKLSVLVLVAIACILPWTIRNRIELGSWVPIRSNFWPEMYFGNVTFDAHPSQNSMLYQQQGEMGFAHNLRRQVIAAVFADPGEFLRHTIDRVIEFWTQPRRYGELPLLFLIGSLAGLALARSEGRDWLSFACVLGLYPLLYYITYTFARYRHPIEPIMYLLSGHAVSRLLSLFGALRPGTST